MPLFWPDVTIKLGDFVEDYYDNLQPIAKNAMTRAEIKIKLYNNSSESLTYLCLDESLNIRDEFKVDSNDMKLRDSTLGWIWIIKNVDGLVAIYNPEEDFENKELMKEGNTVIIRTVDRYDLTESPEGQGSPGKRRKDPTENFINLITMGESFTDNWIYNDIHQLEAPDYFRHTKKAGKIYFQMKWIPFGESDRGALGVIKESPMADGRLILNFKYASNLINRHLGIRGDLPNPYIKFKPIGAYETETSESFYSTTVCSQTTDPQFNQIINIPICCNKEEGAY